MGTWAVQGRPLAEEGRVGAAAHHRGLVGVEFEGLALAGGEPRGGTGTTSSDGACRLTTGNRRVFVNLAHATVWRACEDAITQKKKRF